MGESVARQINKIKGVIDQEDIYLLGASRLRARVRDGGVGECVNKTRFADVGASDEGYLGDAVGQNLVVAC